MVTQHEATSTDRARAAAETVVDPELPMLTLADLGVLRDVAVTGDGKVLVSVTPTYSGCPALREMRQDLDRRVREAGFDDVEVRTVLQPPWTTDWISERGRRKLAENGIAPPGQAPPDAGGPVPLMLSAPKRRADCPHCGARETEEISEFSATACRALRKCLVCREPFEHVKEI